jgi:hypothetical protein
VRSLGHNMSIMGTGIYGATPQWARIGAIVVVCSCHDALAADQLPPHIVGVWCLTSEGMLPERYAYRRCKDNNRDIIVRSDGFDAQETSCNLNKIERQGAAWLASFACSGAGLSWLEDDERAKNARIASATCNHRCSALLSPHVAASPPGRVHRTVPPLHNR